MSQSIAKKQSYTLLSLFSRKLNKLEYTNATVQNPHWGKTTGKNIYM